MSFEIECEKVWLVPLDKESHLANAASQKALLSAGYRAYGRIARRYWKGGRIVMWCCFV